MSEFSQALNDPAYALNIALGPPFGDLKPQQRGSGLVIGNQFADEPRRFVLKKAHMSADDYRIFDASHSKRVVAVMHHYGKNPYGDMDPLGLSNTAQWHQNRTGEWDSLAEITGYLGMPQLRIRPKSMSMHGRQFVQSRDGQHTYFNIADESRLKTMSIRPNLAVCKGEEGELLYKVHPDLMGRTFQIENPQGELVCFVAKSTKALIMNATLGAGSEMMIDVAPGADWTAMLAIVMSIYQVGSHWAKDAMGNFVINPLQGEVVSSTLEATGLQGMANSLGHGMDQGMGIFRKVQEIRRLFQ